MRALVIAREHARGHIRRTHPPQRESTEAGTRGAERDGRNVLRLPAALRVCCALYLRVRKAGGQMAVKKVRGKAERRTAPARGTKARGAAKKILKRTARGRAAKATPASRRRTGPAPAARTKFAPADRVFHLVDPAAFVVTTDKKTGIEHKGPAKNAKTTCCAKPIAKVYGVAVSRDVFLEPVAWCAGVPQ